MGMSKLKVLRDHCRRNDNWCWTIEEVAKSTGIKPSALRRYEQNMSTISIKDLKTLAEFYNVSTDYLLGLETKNRNVKFTYQDLYEYIISKMDGKRFSIISTNSPIEMECSDHNDTVSVKVSCGVLKKNAPANCHYDNVKGVIVFNKKTNTVSIENVKRIERKNESSLAKLIFDDNPTEKCFDDYISIDVNSCIHYILGQVRPGYIYRSED